MTLIDTFNISLTKENLIHLKYVSENPDTLYSFYKNSSLIDNGLVCYNSGHTKLTKLGNQVLKHYKKIVKFLK